MTGMLPHKQLHASILHLLHRAGQQAETLFTFEAATSALTPRQYAVLLTVDQNEDISQTGLVATTGIDRSTLADVVRRLVNKGLLQRKRTRQDARMYAVRLTDRGRQALAAAQPAAERADEKILSMLKNGERMAFIQTLSNIVLAMDQLAETEPQASAA
jgi:DNA-binding MarR family transcriptional regulator